MRTVFQSTGGMPYDVRLTFVSHLCLKRCFALQWRQKRSETQWKQKRLFFYQHTHTYANIQREKCFCINFLPISCYDRLVNTIHQNEWDDDEFAAGGFTVSNAKTIHAPAISEAFLTMECTLKEIQDLSGAGITAMVIGQVQRISVEETYAQGYEQRYGKDGFMLLVPAPQDLVTGEPNQSAIATVHIEKYDWFKERAKMAVSNIDEMIINEKIYI